MKRTFLLSAFILAVTLAFTPDRARADEITVAGSTASAPPVGITFALNSFSGVPPVVLQPSAIWVGTLCPPVLASTTVTL